MSSLSGQNSNERISDTRSSRVSSTLFYQLRKFDRKITEIDNHILFYRRIFSHTKANKLEKKRKVLDDKRKHVRNKRKGYETQNIN
jgi:hypothetical protein